MYRRKDRFYRRAKAEGLRSRAAFKLEDLGAELISPGNRVVDLGAWPGGWLQVAARHTGPNGVVVGVDLAEVPPIGLPNVRVIRGDVRDPEIQSAVDAAVGGEADVVLSDLAPKLTGIRDRDQALAEELAAAALATALRLLRPGGGFVCKVFMGPAHAAFVSDVRRAFDRVTVTKPEATRAGSSELYVVARGRKSGAGRLVTPRP
ncbi:MAG: rRNA (uridine2552-2-O)-methyltransferase [Candidatus Binatota bacterium]|jgi:23S rRNA (uridine2552-2'-O)-methyltransferase|nr:rRNA (uridine2552-2-O)-methyltransferase [Candidatus Binatota bacterium]